MAPTDSRSSSLGRDTVADASAYFDRWLALQRRHLRVPGVQAAVLHRHADHDPSGDDLVLSTAHGVASVETGEMLTERHLFRIASHSKTFTATALLQLAERGALRLDDTLARWIPALAGAPIAGVTLREVLSHSGGVIRDGADGDFWQLFRVFPDAPELLRVAGDASAVLARNERFKYSNISYSLLGLVVEAASGQPYDSFVAEHVVAPLGLADTCAEYDPARADRYAAGHSALSYADRRLVIDHVDTRAMAAATGFTSTAADVVRYMGAHVLGDHRLLTDDSKRIMQKVEWEVAGAGVSYGLGFEIRSIGSRRVIGHGGGYPGHITRTYLDPVAGVAVSVLTNAIDGPATGWAMAFVALLNLAAEGPGTAVDSTRFRGRFATLWGVYDVVDLGGRWFQIDPTLPDPTAAVTELEVVDERTLRVVRTNGYAAPGEQLVYTFGDDGAVRSLRGASGTTAYPVDEFRRAVEATDRVTLGGGLRV